jgi:formylglycine-generating enzyme required for sulfatase activity
MSSLAHLPELVGFFSYAREDDADSNGASSALRSRIQGELRGQLGRSTKTFRLWQDKEAIPSGTFWETEIKNAVAQASFFIPIITPTVVASPYCRFELDAFLAREAALGRSDLVFPILYIDVPSLQDSVRPDAVLSLIAKRQYVDWREFRHLDVNSTEVRRAIERFCGHIRDALRRPWVSPEERAAQEKTAALQRAEDERKRQESEARRLDEEARNRAVAEQEREQADQKRRQREAEAERKRAEAERQRAEERRLRQEAEAKRRAEEEQRRTQKEERRPLQPLQARPLWPPSRLVLLAASLIGVSALGALGVWLFAPLTPVPGVALTPDQERALKPKDTFRECANCPEMTVVPAGSFTMGSPAALDELPQPRVTIAQQFAVGQFTATFNEWDACVGDGGCNDYRPDDVGWGRGRRPVINVSWDDAEAYVSWLSKKTGRSYRLLSEAEYEYATRAGTTTAYPWGDDIGKNNANCNGCGSKWDNKQTAPVGSFAANGFDLYDMVGNVWNWTEDCYRVSYEGAPTDGSVWAWKGSYCSGRVPRGGSWDSHPANLRSAYRRYGSWRFSNSGFRVARTLLAP